MANKKTRREFIELGLKTGIAIPFLFSGLYGCNSATKQEQESATTDTDSKKLNILILGGTSFLGPHQIAYAMSRGHSISTFTRGKTLPSVHIELFKDVERLIGDRKDNLKALEGRKWDVVIDNSGRDTEWTRKTAELLKDNCELYVYTSSTGVFYPYLGGDFKESDKVLLEEPENVSKEEELEYWYGVMKATSEQEAIRHFGEDRTIIVRPTYMIGPADKSNRFIHWPIRLSKGGEILVPGKSDDKVQYIDVRDVAEWMIRLIETKTTGTFNAVGPNSTETMHTFMDKAKQSFDVDSSFVKIDDYDFLKAQNIYYIVPWIIAEGNNIGSAKISNAKAKANGLTFRPLTTSIKDTHDWWNSDAVSQEQRDAVEQDPKSILQREASIIQTWKAR